MNHATNQTPPHRPYTAKEIATIKVVLGCTPYSFHRADGFYVLELQSDEEAKANGECNPGTLLVINELTGETVFTPELGNN